MKSSAHTLRVQILDREGNIVVVFLYFTKQCAYSSVRQLEQQVKTILDAIAIDEAKKKELIRGEAVDKAEQLSELHIYIIYEERRVFIIFVLL